MATIKSYSDLQQSKKLAEILPLESADMCWRGTTNPLAANTTFWLYTKYIKGEGIPAWSLAALLGVLPNPLLHKTYTGWRCDTYSENGTQCLLGNTADNPVDACYKLILKLNELKIL